jgi:predicted amidohydrolase YtcJ
VASTLADRASSAPELLFLGGRVLTMNDAQPEAEAVAVRGNRVLAVGHANDLRGLAGPSTRVVDLAGKTLVPGFFDSHCHVIWTGLRAVRPSIEHARSIDDVVDVIRQAAATRSAGEWIVSAPTWRMEQFREGRYPTRHDLDRAAPDHPVYLPNFHAGSANSLALRIAGLDRSTPGPVGGVVERDADGEPTGVLQEQPALWLIERHLPDPSFEELAGAYRAIEHVCLAGGVTSVIEPALSPAEMRAYHRLQREGRLQLRVTMMLRVDCHPERDAMLRLLESWGVATGFGDERLRLGGIKLFLDGAFFGGKALLEQPYLVSDHAEGVQVHTAETLNAVVERAHEYGWSVGVHASGDGAVRLLLDAYERANARAPIRERRFQAMHAHLTRPEDRRRMAELGVVVVPQPPAITARAKVGRAVLGQERAERLWPLRDFFDRGVVVAGSSDAPIYAINPLLGIWSAVTRRTADGDTIAPEQRLTRLEALRMYTLNGAYAAMAERSLGSIEPGKLADLAVLSGDFLACHEDELKDLRVLMTVSDGRVVHEVADVA